jgi:serine/threonine-protein kinase HipA
LYISKEDNNPHLTLLNHPNGFILKLQTKEYANLLEAEFLVMQMATATGIRTVPFALIKMPSQDG